MVGTPTYVPGKYGQAIQFVNTPPTSSQALYYTIPSSVGSMVNGLTVSFWLNPQSLPNAQNQTYVFIDGPIVGSTGAFWMFMNNGNTTTALLYGQNPSGGLYYPGVNGPVVPQGSWTHMTGVWTPYTGTSNTMTLYVNGVFAQSIYYANSFTINRLTLATNGGSRGSPCTIDDLRIFNTALTATQVQAVYNAQGILNRGIFTTQIPSVSGYTYVPFSALPASFTLVQTSTGNAWTINTGSNQIRDGTWGGDPVLTMVPSQPGDIYSARNPGIWYRLAGNSNYVRHFSLVMLTNGYTPGSFDFAWAFYLQNGTTNQIKIWNPFPGDGVGYWVQSGLQTAGRIAISTTDPNQAHVYTISSTISTYFQGVPPFSQVFSNAQATSNIGPTQIQLNATYPSIAPVYLTSNTGIQTWTVPVTGVYSLIAAGAAGGSSSNVAYGASLGTPGRGVIVGCQAIFQKSQVLSLIVGQKGVSAVLQTTSNIGGGGGGGSFIVDFKTGTLYIAAGGGGGSSASPAGGSYSGDPSGFDASYGQDGVAGGGVPGGTGGNGGFAFTGGSTGQAGGSGGGFYTNGGSGIGPPFQAGQGGFAVLNGAQGGLSANNLNFTNSFGGFGCGAGGGGNLSIIISGGAAGGGGGGYSGGGSGVRHGPGGGGGGSYVPIGQTMQQLGYCTSNGYISITYLYPVSTQMTGTPLFSQLSRSATASAVGAFSLRAVNGTSPSGTAKAVQIQAHPIVQWPPTALTSNTTVISGQLYGNGTYTASSSNGFVTNGYQEFYAFDYNPGTYYEENYPAGQSYNNSGALINPTFTQTTVSGATAQGEWLQIQLPTTMILRNYTFVPRIDQAQRCPRTFWIAGSNDGTTWSNVHFQTGITGYTNPTGITFTTGSNTAAYSYFRVIVNSIVGGTGGNQPMNIASWNLYGDSPSYAPNSAQDFWADRLGNLLTAPVTGQKLVDWLGGAVGYVTTWYDQSGKGSHMSCSSTSIQPKIDTVNKWIDFKTSAWFDTSATPTTGPVPYSNTQNYTIICRHNTIGNGAGGICGVSNAAPNYNNTNYTNNFRRGGGTYQSYWFGNDINGGTYAAGNSVTFKWDGTNRYIYSNGSLVTTVASSNWWQTSSSAQMIGKTTNDTTMNGEMYYIFMFNTALSDTDRQLVETLPIS